MKILFVDDEKRWIMPYIDELEYAGFNIHHESTLDGARQFLDKNRDNLDLLILDIMMPHGELFTPEETQDGLRSGVLFFEMIREQKLYIPVIILTSVSDEEVKRMFEIEDKCTFLRKPECFPYELVEVVKSVLSSS